MRLIGELSIKAAVRAKMRIVNLFTAREWRWPTDFRKFMGWIFAATCLGNSITFVRTLPNAVHQHHALSLLQRLLYAPVPSKKPVLIEIVAFTVSRPAAFPGHADSTFLSPRLFPSSRRSASRDSCSPPSALGPATFEPRS